MRILFDERPGENGTGIGRYARTVGSVLAQGLEGHEVLRLGRDGDLQLEACSPIEEELELPDLLEREAIDVYHTPLFHLPAVVPCLSVVTIHDAIPAVK